MAASTTTRFALLGGLAAVLAAGGVFALRSLQQPATAPTAPASIAAPAPPPAAAAPPSVPEPPQLKFPPFVQRFSLTRDSAAYISASLQAPQIYPLKAGTPILSAAKSEDGDWIMALTQDGQAAFVPTAALGPYTPAASPLPAAPADVSGTAQLIDTATLSVGGQQISLAGIKGITGDLVAKLQQAIDDHGGTVVCTAADTGTAFLCKLPDGVDVARLALFNGAAQPGDDASPDYRQQADAARAAHRGMWP